MLSYNIKRGNPDGSTTFLTRVDAKIIPRECDILHLYAANASATDTPDEFIVVAVIHDIIRGENAARHANTQIVSVIVKEI